LCEILQQLFSETFFDESADDETTIYGGGWFWVFLMSWHYKDLVLYHQMCQLLANITYQPKHGEMFVAIFFFSQLLFQIFYFDFNLVGLTIKLSGKIGVRGISRTRAMKLLCGKTSFTVSYTQRVRYLSDIITADGGVLGLKILLRYF